MDSKNFWTPHPHAFYFFHEPLHILLFFSQTPQAYFSRERPQAFLFFVSSPPPLRISNVIALSLTELQGVVVYFSDSIALPFKWSLQLHKKLAYLTVCRISVHHDIQCSLMTFWDCANVLQSIGLHPGLSGVDRYKTNPSISLRQQSPG